MWKVVRAIISHGAMLIQADAVSHTPIGFWADDMLGLQFIVLASITYGFGIASFYMALKSYTFEGRGNDYTLKFINRTANFGLLATLLLRLTTHIILGKFTPQVRESIVGLIIIIVFAIVVGVASSASLMALDRKYR